MNIVLTNLAAEPLPMCAADIGLHGLLPPYEPTPLNDTELVVTVLGDSPSLREELVDAAHDMLEALLRLITAWRERRAVEEEDPVVRVRIHNNGSNGLRVILGSNVNDIEVDPGATYDVEAVNYVEIRELGV